MNDNLDNFYNDLIAEINEQKIKELDKNKDEILDKLTDEIVKRYYYSEGVYQQKSKFDRAIKEASSLLNNPKKYSSILK